MICRVDDTVYRGRVVSLDHSVGPETVAAAIRNDTATEQGTTVSVVAQTPHRVHERVGCLHPDVTVSVRTALADAARARGWRTRYDGRLRQVQRTLSRLTADTIDNSEARRAVAAAESETERLRERTATIRGRLQAEREHDVDASETNARLRETARDLSEAETRAAAARQTLDRTRERARRVRDDLERQFRLEDEAANLERTARAALVQRAREAYVSALLAVPRGPDSVPADPFDVDPLTAALAIARVADFDAPVVLACDRFESAREASRWLGAPVVDV